MKRHATFFKNIAAFIFFKLQQLLIPYIDMMLLVGMYAFTALSGVALMILGLLWVTGGFLSQKIRTRILMGKRIKARREVDFLLLIREEKSVKKLQKKKKRHKKKSKKQ